MTSVIQIKRSSSANSPNTLNPGELAYSYASNTLFIGDANSNVLTLLTNVSSNTAYAQANAARNQANAAYAQANAAYDQANAAFAEANTANSTAANALPATGGTITGSLLITQNLTVNGAVTMTIDGGTF